MPVAPFWYYWGRPRVGGVRADDVPWQFITAGATSALDAGLDNDVVRAWGGPGHADIVRCFWSMWELRWRECTWLSVVTEVA